MSSQTALFGGLTAMTSGEIYRVSPGLLRPSGLAMTKSGRVHLKANRFHGQRHFIILLRDCFVSSWLNCLFQDAISLAFADHE
jgi:hypothetical protein